MDPVVSPIPRTALTREEAAASLGMGLSSFETYVQPEIRLIRRGKLRLVPVSELTRWAEKNAEATLRDAALGSPGGSGHRHPASAVLRHTGRPEALHV